MANREALKALQVRLAQRLQQARSTQLSAGWLGVTAGGANYLFPLQQSGEILPVYHLQTVPHSKPWFLGVINVRGSLYGAADLAQFVACADPAERPKGILKTWAEPHAPMAITLNPQMEFHCALQVHTLVGLRSPEAFTASQPAPEDSPIYFGHQFLDPHGALWQEINLQSLSESPQFLNISA